MHVEIKIVVEDELPRDALYVIRPNQIRLHEPSCVKGAFNGNFTIEHAAGQLISYFQYENRWCSFSLKDLWDYYSFKGWNSEHMLFGLFGNYVEDGVIQQPSLYLAHLVEGSIAVTDLFIKKCALPSLAKV